MKVKLRCLFGAISLMGLGYFINQGSANYIVLSLIMFSFSAFVITFANFVINKNYDINMIEKHIDNTNSAGGYFVTRKDILILIFCFLLCCCASFVAGRSSTTQVPVETNQEQNITINNQDILDETCYVNINTASVEELKTLDGIGESKAIGIITNRHYKTIYQLLSLKIVGEDTFENIREVITVD